MDNILILNEIKKHYNFKSDSDFAKFLGISTTRLGNWRSRNTFDYELVSTKCEDIDANWLFSGKGNMVKDLKSISNVLEPNVEYEKNIDYKEKYFEVLEKYYQLNEEIRKLKDNK